MNLLFYVGAAMALGAIAVTIYAVASAPEGYEDDEGFHAVNRDEAKQPEATEKGRRAGFGLSA